MIITGKGNSPKKEVENLRQELLSIGIELVTIDTKEKEMFCLLGDTSSIDINRFLAMPWVKNVTRIQTPYKLVSRSFQEEDTIIDVNGIKIGGNNNVVVIAGPCAVESKEQIDDIACKVKAAGANMLRGGAYKPRTSPYTFQGLGTKGIEMLKEVNEKYQLPVVSEITSISQINDFVENVDIIQVGARNMQNFELLKALGKIDKPILLKRGFSNTIEEWLMSAEYILAGGNKKVILCERGIRTFEKQTRNTLDIGVISLIKKLTHLPIIIDPSHAAGRYDLVESMALGCIAAGCDGLLIEVHNDPEHALSDGGQSLKTDKLENLIVKGKKIAQVIGRDM